MAGYIICGMMVMAAGYRMALAQEAVPAAAGAEELAVPVAAPPAEAPAPVVVNADDLKGISAASRQEDSGAITVTLDEVALPDVIRLFTRLTGANIIAATTNLKGSVTANLQGVEWRPALESILDGQNLMLIEKPPTSNIFVIEPRAVTAEPWITETFQLSYLKANEAADLLKSMLGLGIDDKTLSRSSSSPYRRTDRSEDEAPKEEMAVVFRKDGRVVSYPAGNAIVVSTTAFKMDEVRQVLKAVDQPRPQVYIEAKIIELAGDAAKKLGIDWSMLDSYGVGIDKLERNIKKTKIRERGDASYAGGERASAWDARGRPIRDATASDPSTVGGTTPSQASPIDGIGGEVDGNGTEGPYINAISGTPGAIAVESWDNAKGFWRAVTDTRTAVFSADAIQVVLSALQTTDDAAIISNPKIIVANEEMAVIDMSTKEPYVAVTRKTEGTGDNTTYTYSTEMEIIPGDNDNLSYVEQAFFTYGIKVVVTPRINNATNITVTIEPTLSTLQDYYEPVAGLSRYPVIESKRVRTVFSLGDGKTAVIGGLTRSYDAEVVKKIPLLGDIPLIGKYLFSHSSKEKQQRETIIFVTVGIVQPDEETTLGRVPEASKLIHKHVTPDGRLIDHERIKADAAAAEAAAKAEAATPAAEAAPDAAEAAATPAAEAAPDAAEAAAEVAEAADEAAEGAHVAQVAEEAAPTPATAD